MQSLACGSVLLLLGSSITAMADNAATKADAHVFEWCLSQFPDEDNPWTSDSGRLYPRPAGKLRPFDLTDAITPPDLVTNTEIIGELPPPIERYRGHWTWPAIERSPAAAVFVERLTPTEMIIATAVRPERGRDRAEYQVERMTLIWTGSRYSYSKVTPEEKRRVEAFISPSGEAMLMISAYSRLVRLERTDGTSEEPQMAPSEAWPWCLISEKLY